MENYGLEKHETIRYFEADSNKTYARRQFWPADIGIIQLEFCSVLDSAPLARFLLSTVALP